MHLGEGTKQREVGRLATPACVFSHFSCPFCHFAEGKAEPREGELRKATQWSLATPDENLGCVTQGQRSRPQTLPWCRKAVFTRIWPLSPWGHSLVDCGSRGATLLWGHACPFRGGPTYRHTRGHRPAPARSAPHPTGAQQSVHSQETHSSPIRRASSEGRSPLQPVLRVRMPACTRGCACARGHT